MAVVASINGVRAAVLGSSGADRSAPSLRRVEQLYQKVMALWHQLHMNTKSLISWNYLRKDIALVQSFSMEKVRWKLLCAWLLSCTAGVKGKSRDHKDWEAKGL